MFIMQMYIAFSSFLPLFLCYLTLFTFLVNHSHVLVDRVELQEMEGGSSSNSNSNSNSINTWAKELLQLKAFEGYYPPMEISHHLLRYVVFILLAIEAVKNAR